jgi:hypothetical protein
MRRRPISRDSYSTLSLVSVSNSGSREVLSNLLRFSALLGSFSPDLLPSWAGVPLGWLDGVIPVRDFIMANLPSAFEAVGCFVSRALPRARRESFH